MTPAVQDDKATGRSSVDVACDRGQAADDDPAAAQYHQSGSQAHATRTRHRHGARVDPREARNRASWRDFDDSRASALLVLAVVEVADQHVSGPEPTRAAPDDGHTVRIDISVARNGRSHRLDPVEVIQERSRT